MCGLFGIMTKDMTQQKLQAFYDLSIVSMTRGVHSTGIMAFSHNNKKKDHKWVYHKAVEDALTFMSSKRVENVYQPKDRDVVALMGHCRHATVGHHTVDNAHPHRAGNIIGMHNGTIPQFARGVHQAEGSDSRVLFKMMEKEGIIPALKSAQYGAYALSFVDLNTGLVNFIRNKERPLWYMSHKDNHTFVYASERRMLDFVNLNLMNEPVLLPPFRCLTVDPRTLEIKEEDLEDKVSFKFTPPPPYSPHFFKRSVIEGEYKEVGEVSGVKSSITVCRTNKNPRFKVTGFRGFAGVFLSLKEASYILQDGCSNCTKQSDVEDVVHWIDYDSHICDKCRNDDPTALQYIANIDEPGNMIVKYFEE